MSSEDPDLWLCNYPNQGGGAKCIKTKNSYPSGCILQPNPCRMYHALSIKVWQYCKRIVSRFLVVKVGLQKLPRQSPHAHLMISSSRCRECFHRHPSLQKKAGSRTKQALLLPRRSVQPGSHRTPPGVSSTSLELLINVYSRMEISSQGGKSILCAYLTFSVSSFLREVSYTNVTSQINPGCCVS